MTENLAAWTTETRAPFIYALVDPMDVPHVRYVGMAMQAGRPHEHAKHAKCDQKHSHLFHWIRLLQAEGREPSVLILEQLPESAQRNFVGQVESMYISSLRKIGHRLTNVSDGGWGGHTRYTPEMARAVADANKLRVHTPESRAAASAAGKKRMEDPRERAKLSRVRSLEERAKQSDATAGVPKTAAHREAIRVAHFLYNKMPEGIATRKAAAAKAAITRKANDLLLTPEQKAARRKPHTQETRDLLSEIVSQAMTPERRAEMSRDAAARVTQESRAAASAKTKEVYAAKQALLTPEQIAEIVALRAARRRARDIARQPARNAAAREATARRKAERLASRVAGLKEKP